MAEVILYQLNREQDGSSLVHWAAARGSTATLDKALKHGLSIHQALPWSRSWSRSDSVKSTLQTAVSHGQDIAVTWLLDHGADIAQEVPFADDGMWPSSAMTSLLHNALCERLDSTASLSISRGAPLKYHLPELDFNHPSLPVSRMMTNALLDASECGVDNVVEALVKDYGMSLNSIDGQGRDALSCAAMDDSNVSTVETLLGLGACVDGVSEDWEDSPLHHALLAANMSIANALLDAGARIHNTSTRLRKSFLARIRMRTKTASMPVWYKSTRRLCMTQSYPLHPGHGLIVGGYRFQVKTWPNPGRQTGLHSCLGSSNSVSTSTQVSLIIRVPTISHIRINVPHCN